jgi:hypothetical protein
MTGIRKETDSLNVIELLEPELVELIIRRNTLGLYLGAAYFLSNSGGTADGIRAFGVAGLG